MEPSSKKQKKPNLAKATAVKASTGFKRVYATTKANVEYIQNRDKKTRRFKEPLVSAQMTELWYGKDGKRGEEIQYEDTPWAGAVRNMEDAFERYRVNPKNNIVWDYERELVSQNIDNTRDWFNAMTRTQWTVETEHSGPPRNFTYEQQMMNQLTAQKEDIRGDVDVSESAFL